jgi:hypothetical protein
MKVSPHWLDLREPADAAARASQFVEPVRQYLAGAGTPAVIHDLGAGTGSMLRWLAPRIPGPQHWVLHDHDADLLARAAVDTTVAAADGARVTIETRTHDITRPTPADLVGAHVVTASALLDMLSVEEIERIVAACTAVGCPSWLTISVIGIVDLTPPDPLDKEVATAFNDHQGRLVGDRCLLGPDALAATVDAFRRRGAAVQVKASPWRLGAGQARLAAEWFRGWLGAACEQRPGLAARTAEYGARRLAEAEAGRLGVVVHHGDLLANCG